jgi:hypothetical protein
MKYRIVQPWGPDKARQSTVVSEHRTVAAAFAEIDRVAEEIVKMALPTDAIELVVLDRRGEIVERPGTH